MSRQFGVALARAAVGAIITGLAAGLAVWHGQGPPFVSETEYAFAATAVSYLVVRGGAEGFIDTQAAQAAPPKTP